MAPSTTPVSPLAPSKPGKPSLPGGPGKPAFVIPGKPGSPLGPGNPNHKIIIRKKGAVTFMKLVPNHHLGDGRSTAHTEDNFKPKAAKDFCCSMRCFHITNLKMSEICMGNFSLFCENPNHTDSYWNDWFFNAKCQQ